MKKLLLPFAPIVEKSPEGYKGYSRIKKEYEGSFVEIDTKDLSTVTLVTMVPVWGRDKKGEMVEIGRTKEDRLKMIRVSKERNDKEDTETKNDEGLCLYVSSVCSVLFGHLHQDGSFYSFVLYYHDLDDQSFGVRYENSIGNVEACWNEPEPEEEINPDTEE